MSQLPGEEKAPGRPSVGLPVPRGGYERAGEGLFIRASSDSARVKGFKLNEGRLRLAIRRTFLNCEGDEAWNRLPISGMCSRCNFEQPGLVENVPGHGRGVETR